MAVHRALWLRKPVRIVGLCHTFCRAHLGQTEPVFWRATHQYRIYSHAAAHLKSYFRQGNVTRLWSWITGLAWSLRALGCAFPPSTDRSTTLGLLCSSALLRLATLEHWLMVIPLPDAKLWRWMFPTLPTNLRQDSPMNFDTLFSGPNRQLKIDGNYRYFAELRAQMWQISSCGQSS